MAGFIDSVLPFIGLDLIGVYNQNFIKQFPQARSIKITVKEEAKLMEHPIESGATITDFRIIQPVEIEISFVLNSIDYPDVYLEIKRIYLNGELLIVQTKSGIYENQLIQSLPHEEDPSHFDAIVLTLKLKEVLFAVSQTTITPRNPKDQSTVDRGTQQGSTVDPGRRDSVAKQIRDFAKSKLK